MTKEALQRAIELEPLIKMVKDNIDRWECARSFAGYAEIKAIFVGDRGNYSYVKPTHIPFDVAKAISLDGFRKELKKLEDEFNSL
jgi:hypothetical protein